MADVTADTGAEHAASLRRRYLIQFGASMHPARTLGPDIVGNDYTGWWVYGAGPVIGAAIAVAIIAAVRGLPDKDEREAAQGGALPIRGTPRDGHPEGRQAPAG